MAQRAMPNDATVRTTGLRGISCLNTDDMYDLTAMDTNLRRCKNIPSLMYNVREILASVSVSHVMTHPTNVLLRKTNPEKIGKRYSVQEPIRCVSEKVGNGPRPGRGLHRALEALLSPLRNPVEVGHSPLDSIVVRVD